MKKIRCPKCDSYVSFEDAAIETGTIVMLHCDDCGKDFKVRFKVKPSTLDSLEKKEEESQYGSVVVVENVFCKRQEFQLKEGDNVFGRKNNGTVISCPIETSDMSMDRIHCTINVKMKNGNPVYTIWDNMSLVGTFVSSRILGDKERLILEDGEVITLGATSLIFKSNNECE